MRLAQSLSNSSRSGWLLPFVNAQGCGCEVTYLLGHTGKKSPKYRSSRSRDTEVHSSGAFAWKVRLLCRKLCTYLMQECAKFHLHPAKCISFTEVKITLSIIYRCIITWYVWDTSSSLKIIVKLIADLGMKRRCSRLLMGSKCCLKRTRLLYKRM